MFQTRGIKARLFSKKLILTQNLIIMCDKTIRNERQRFIVHVISLSFVSTHTCIIKITLDVDKKYIS